MVHIQTTFVHGNGPYSRIIDLAIEINNLREQKGKERLPFVIPLVYGERQRKIIKEDHEKFLEKNPQEILLDEKQGEILSKVLYKGSDYNQYLINLLLNYDNTENELKQHLDGVRLLETVSGEKIYLDLRGSVLELGLSNRIATDHNNAFYIDGGVGYFSEVLERALKEPNIKLDKKLMKKVIPFAREMEAYQVQYFLSDPGVFSYDVARKKRNSLEEQTPPFIHVPEKDEIELDREGIYVMATGIDGIRESGMFNAVKNFGMQIYCSPFDKKLQEELNAIPLNPKAITNPKIVAQYARTGWSSVWLAHMAKKGFISPPHMKTDDPEIFLNIKGMKRLGLGVVLSDNPKKTLEDALWYAAKAGSYNEFLVKKYGTLDGIKYTAKKIIDTCELTKKF